MLYKEIQNRIAKKIKAWDIEHFYVVAVKQDTIIGIRKMGIQNINSVSINPYKIEQYLQKKDANEYIMAHNHPNNNLLASYGDVCSTNFFKQVISYPCIGCMIITKQDYSFIPIIWDEKEDNNNDTN